MTYTFSDRFTYDLPNPPSDDAILAMSEAQLYALMPRLKEMVEMVRRHSVLLRKKTAAEIYFVITDHADPSIGLRLAAARDKRGNPLFPDIDTIKRIMYGPSDTDSRFSGDLNIFVSGIKGISATLAAAVLIGQLAQIREQEIHARALEKRAYEELDRLLQVPELENLAAGPATPSSSNARFYFEATELNLQQPLQAEVYLPALAGNSAWYSVGTYSGQVSVAQIVADLADTINSLTLSSNYSNLLAAPVLASPHNTQTRLHHIEFSSRYRDAVIAAEVVTVRLRLQSGGQLPFSWGVHERYLAKEEVNSVLVAVQATRASSVALGLWSEDTEPTVLWFRRAPIDPTTGLILSPNGPIPDSAWQNAQLSFRVSPTMDSERTVSFTYTGLPAERPGAFALTLINELFAIKGSSRALGALIRNDSPTARSPLTAVELVAFTVTNPQTWLVLDLLQLPPDIEVAVGNTRQPLTPFSSRPRSVRVPSRYDFRAQPTTSNRFETAAGAQLVKVEPSDRILALRDRLRRQR